MTRVRYQTAATRENQFHRWKPQTVDWLELLQITRVPFSPHHPPTKKKHLLSQKKNESRKSFTHFEVKDDAEMLKNVAPDWLAIHFPIRVFPVPGGPNSKIPLGGRRNPVKMSGRSIGHTTTSWKQPINGKYRKDTRNYLYCIFSKLQAGNIVPWQFRTRVHNFILNDFNHLGIDVLQPFVYVRVLRTGTRFLLLFLFPKNRLNFLMVFEFFSPPFTIHHFVLSSSFFFFVFSSSFYFFNFIINFFCISRHFVTLKKSAILFFFHEFFLCINPIYFWHFFPQLFPPFWFFFFILIF